MLKKRTKKSKLRPHPKQNCNKKTSDPFGNLIGPDVPCTQQRLLQFFRQILVAIVQGPDINANAEPIPGISSQT